MKKIFIFTFGLVLAGFSLLFFNNNIVQADSLNLNADDIVYEDVAVDNDNFVEVLSSSSTYNNSTIRLVLQEDIDLLGDDLSTLYENLNVFTGTFDGNGYTISNLSLSSGTSYYGLFPYAQNATIKNVRIYGSVNFSFSEQTSGPIFAGVLVGYGENVHIQNCELYNVTFTSQEDPDQPGSSISVREEQEIALPISSNLTFGGVIGYATSFTSLGENSQSVIENCVNYYDISAVVVRNSRASIGGIVGHLTNGSKVLNCLNFGDINLSTELTEQGQYEFYQYLGGIGGEIDGSGTYIKNTAFAGEIGVANTDILSVFYGTIVGQLNCPQASQNYNVNFCYWTQGLISYYGTGYQVLGGILEQVSLINQSFLQNSENFDMVESGFDFDYSWTMVDSEIVLQNFQDFTFTLGMQYDDGGIIESANLSTQDQEGSEVVAHYGQTVTIEISLGQDYVGYYLLDDVMLNGANLPESDYSITETNDDSSVNGYEIEIVSSDRTDGTYTFSTQYVSYACEITVSDEAIQLNQGTVRSVSNNGAETTLISPNFSYNNRSLTVSASGNDIYTFDHWEIFYSDDEGQFTTPGSLAGIEEDATINIYYGNSPFNQPFRLVAYFTDDDAVEIDIANFDEDMIESITIRGTAYEGEAIKTPFNSTSVTFVVITKEGYAINEEEFLSYIQRLYSENSTSGLGFTSTQNADGSTTYQFTLNMRYLENSLTTNQFTVNLYVEEDESNNGDPLLWVYIVVPIVAVLIIGLVIFLIVRHKGGGNGKSQSRKEKKKEENYRDYYV